MESDELYLKHYKTILRKVDESLDIRGSALSALVQICISNHGTLSKAVRDKFKDCVPDSYFDYIESVTNSALHSGN